MLETALYTNMFSSILVGTPSLHNLDTNLEMNQLYKTSFEVWKLIISNWEISLYTYMKACIPWYTCIVQIGNY